MQLLTALYPQIHKYICSPKKRFSVSNLHLFLILDIWWSLIHFEGETSQDNALKGEQ